MTSDLREGSLRSEAAERGVDVLLYEAGEGLRFDEFAVRAGMMGIMRVLHGADMVDDTDFDPVVTPSLLCSSSQWVRAPAGGLLRAFKGDGDVVEEGDLLAAVSDPFGVDEHEILAPAPGIVVGRAVLPVVNEGDAVFHLAAVRQGDAEATVEEIAAQLDASPLFDEDEII